MRSWERGFGFKRCEWRRKNQESQTPGMLCLLQNPCWELLELGKPAAAPCALWGLGEQPGSPSPHRVIFGVPGLLLPPPPTCQGDPMGAEAPRDPGKCPFPGERLGSAAAEGSRASFGWREVAKQFPVFSLFSVNADSAPQMSLLPCPCPLSPHSFTLEPSPPRTSRLCIPAAGKGRSPGSLMAFNPWS